MSLPDLLLVAHFAIAAFIVVGLPLVWLGAALHWNWVRNRRFRQLHLAAIGFVAVTAVLGIACPLTVWEDRLRGSEREAGFVADWVGRVLYWNVPLWVFALIYVAWAAATLITWMRVPPRP